MLLKIDCMENNTHLVRNFLCKYYVRNKDKRVTKKSRRIGNALEMLICDADFPTDLCGKEPRWCENEKLLIIVTVHKHSS
jgi:hypothetical protein